MMAQRLLRVTWYRDEPAAAYAACKAYDDGRAVGYFTAGPARRGFELSLPAESVARIMQRVLALPAYQASTGVLPYIGFDYQELGTGCRVRSFHYISHDDRDKDAFHDLRDWVEQTFPDGDRVAKH